MESEKILYDISVPAEWDESVPILAADGLSLWRTLATLTKACLRFTVDKLKHRLSPALPAVTSLVNSRLPWQLAITSDGALLAVLRDEVVEIRSVDEDFEALKCICQVARDPRPQWRRMLWSEEGSLLAVATSYGAVHVFTSSGESVCQIPGKSTATDSSGGSPVHAITSLAFITPQKGDEESISLLVVLHYGGTLDTYSLRSQNPPVHLHSFSFNDYFPCGVDAMLYHPHLSVLLLSSDSGCVSGWRLLDGFPHWAPMLGQNVEKKPRRLLSGVMPFSSPQASTSGVVFAMSLSPSGSLLATIDVSGRLCLWEVPSFKLKRAWEIEDQPTSQETDAFPPFGASAPKRKGPPLLLDVSWWSDEALIVVNTAGEVTVPSIISLSNLLGDAAEPGACITPAHDGQFFILECESHTSPTGRYRLPSLSEDSEDSKQKDPVEEEEESSLARVSTSLFKQVLYFLTESERFRPPRKKRRVVTKKYRLACLKSMPPEECYKRKMQNEEYGEALVLAQQYDLDCDLVYQSQWKSHPISIATIQDYLSKIVKRSWVLQECLYRVPEEYDAVRELLEYGLVRTSFKELKKTSINEEGGMVSPEVGEWEIEEELQKWKRLSPGQVSICQYRHKLLTYLDRLSTYEEILGGPSAADEHFDGEFFEQFRCTNLVKIAVGYARDGDYRGLEILFTFHGEVLLPHRLAILSNFPETTRPSVYQCLLPEIRPNGSLKTWEQEQHRDKDWVEIPTLRKLCSLPDEVHSNLGDFLYEENPELQKYESPTSSNILTEWYTERATEIEEFSGQVDNALNLVELGIDSGVKGLDVLHHELQTLQTLVYQCDVDSRLNLTRLHHMTNLEILQLMMRESTAEEFILDFCQRALPFLKRVEGLHKGAKRKLLQDYITIVAKGDLAPCMALFQQSKGKGPASAYDPVIKDTEELMSLALKCIYACDRSDQLEIADRIVECLPLHTTTSSRKFVDLHKQVDKLEDYLSALDKLQNYGVYQPVHYIRSIQDNAGEAKQLMVKLTRVAGRQQPPLNELGWRNLLQHLLTLRSRVFTCLDQAACYKIFTESLLCSGQETNILLANQVLTLIPLPSHSTKLLSSSGEVQPYYSQGFTYRLPYETSVQLVLSAAREYFNSASGFMDKDMDLARTCLGLFREVTFAIQSELNMIASLSLLDDFGINILPVQVRLCENKLDIIRNVLDSSHGAYKRYEKIFHLAHLLGLDKGRETQPEQSEMVSRSISDGHGHTVILVALAALERQDFKLSHRLCTKLMNSRFPAAWEVCRNLAMQDQFKDLNSKIALLNFSLTHCPPEEIQLILKERSVLEVEILYLKCQEGGQGSGVATGGAVQHLVGRGVKQIMSRGAGAVQHFIGQRPASGMEQFTSKPPEQIIHECVSGLQSASMSFPGKESVPLSLSYHPFYSTLLGPEKASEYASKVPIDYASFKPASVRFQLVLNQALLRAMQVADTLSEGDNGQDYNQVLLRLAEESCQTDTQLMLGYLLSLPEPQDVKKLLDKIIPHKFSLQLSIYYVCLQLYAVSSNVQETSLRQQPYLHSPSDLVEHVTSNLQSDWPEGCQLLVELLQHYRELLADHTQAEVLQNLGLGIDIQKFTQDLEYKRGTILNLARTSDRSVFNTTLSLAQRHHIPMWEVYMQLLDWLLTISRLGIQEIQQTMKEVNMIEVILQRSQQTVDTLRSNTFPNLPGTKYSVLILYYNLLQQCVEHGAQVEEAVEIDTHLKLLKKFKSAVPGLNYKLLMNGEDPLSILIPVLTSTNVHVVSKLANKIPCMELLTKERSLAGFNAAVCYRTQKFRLSCFLACLTHLDGSIVWTEKTQDEECGFLTPGMVFSAYSEKLFWQGDGKHPHPKSTADWLHRYEACYEYLNRLTPDEFYKFVQTIALSRKSLQLDLDTRSELLKRASKFLYQRMKPTSVPSGTPSEQIIQELESCLKHLQNLHGLESTIPPGVAEEEWRQFVKEFDLSMAIPDVIHSLATRMVESKLPLTAIDTILSLAKSVHSHKFTVQSIAQGALLTNLESLSEKVERMKRIENIICSVSQAESGNCDLMSSDDVLEVLRPYCSESSHSADTRRTLLLLMEKYLTLSEEDVHLLLLYQTQTLLAEFFSQQVDLEEVSSIEAQQILFGTLLKESTSVDQLLTLAALLEAWSSSCSSLQSCWIELLHAFANKPEGVEHVVTFRAGVSQVPLEVDEKLYSSLLTSNILEAMKLALVSSTSTLICRALEDLKHRTTVTGRESESPLRLLSLEVGYQIQFDADFLELVILKDQISSIANTPVYPPLCEYLKNPSSSCRLNTRLFARLLCCSEDEVSKKLSLENPAQRVKKAATQLHRSGLKMEAGSLLLSTQVFHPGLATLNSALAYISSRLL